MNWAKALCNKNCMNLVLQLKQEAIQKAIHELPLPMYIGTASGRIEE